MHLKWWTSNLYEKNNYFVILYSHVFIIIQYYDNAFQKLYFLMQWLPICYRIHRSSYLKYGGPDPPGPRAPKSGGSADPADPVLPTPLHPDAQYPRIRLCTPSCPPTRLCTPSCPPTRLCTPSCPPIRLCTPACPLIRICILACPPIRCTSACPPIRLCTPARPPIRLCTSAHIHTWLILCLVRSLFL